MDKMNLDELFREKFKAFQEIPDEKVWTAIENSLDKKRKKRIIPLWWKLGGVAAVLTIALIVLYPLGDTVGENPKVTDTEKTGDGATNPNPADADKRDVREDIIPIPTTPNNAVVDGAEEGKKLIDSEPRATSPKTQIKKDSHTQNPENTSLTANERYPNKENAERVETAAKHPPILKRDDTDVFGNKEVNALATTGPDTTEQTEATKADAQAKEQDGIMPDREGQGILLGEADKYGGKDVVATDDDDSSGKIEDKANGHKKSIFETLEERPDYVKITEGSGSRWSAGPRVAPVYFNAMGEGSPIDPGFSSNSKSGTTNLSYGLSIAYAINDKLRVRSGIHKAEYGYDTNDVGFSPTLAASSGGRLQNVDNTGGTENLAVNDAISNSEFPNSLASEFSALNSARDGTVVQNFGYLEVPLELDYALIDRRFGINLVGGISSLFLIDNSLTLSSGELTAEIGEARNLNGLNFSTNIGFGVNFKFMPKIQLNIEPVFKYQLNTFSNTSGDFRPYSIGVYSGLNFEF